MKTYLVLLILDPNGLFSLDLFKRRKFFTQRLILTFQTDTAIPSLSVLLISGMIIFFHEERVAASLSTVNPMTSFQNASNWPPVRHYVRKLLVHNKLPQNLVTYNHTHLSHF